MQHHYWGDQMRSTRTIIAILILLLGAFLFALAQSLPDNFQRLLQQNSMLYAIPSGFVSTPVIDNGGVVYDYAIKSKTAKLEIRYRIWPIGKELMDDPKRNWMYYSTLITIALNISNGQMIQPKPYPKADVKAEFGADGGSSGAVRTDSDFGKGYKYCLISVIHKDDVADAYTFFLYNDQKTLMDAIFTDKTYHALKFK